MLYVLLCLLPLEALPLVNSHRLLGGALSTPGAREVKPGARGHELQERKPVNQQLQIKKGMQGKRLTKLGQKLTENASTAFLAAMMVPAITSPATRFVTALASSTSVLSQVGALTSV